MKPNHAGQILDFSTCRPSPKGVSAAIEKPTTARSADFLWVDFDAGKQRKGQTLSGAKQTFLKTKLHQRRREAQLQKLRTSIVPFPVQSSQGKNHVFVDESFPPALNHPPILYRSIDAEIKQCFPSLGVSSAVDLDLYFHYYNNYTSRACFPLSFDFITKWLWEQALLEPALVPVILAGSATQRGANLFLSGAPKYMIEDCTRDSLQLRVQSVRTLRRFLDNPVGVDYEKIVLFVTQLLGTEQIEANDQASRVHFKGLGQLIDAAGGLDNLGDYTVATVYCNDHLSALIRNSTPMFRMSPRWRERVTREMASLKNHVDFTRLPSLGSRLSNSPWLNGIHPKLPTLIESLKVLVLGHEGITKSGKGQHTIKHNCISLLAHELLCLADECAGKPIDDTLRLSLLVYSAVRLWAFQGLACMYGVSLGLQKTINEGYEVLLAEAPDLLLWALFMGSFASQNLDCHGWFLSQLMDIAEYLSLTEWDCARVVLGEVFFVFRSTDQSARVIWNSALQLRSSLI
ncbi:hypothetical protein N7492_010171 [Penicillium capsulatum]|uniref:Transcription factor domain-containing protein n=1 Tax=Penicillium capsulatum TaxID=69766 RepID=A0A9W9HP46_9EURO|nr:hypothetical protein N7492_010171 [Penicillium capsulatum]KAJ6112679.1 hypothetical protein N7512_008003 [Penicillium capsulatum]